MRLLGDSYVKSEFRAHRDVENPVHIVCVFPLFSIALLMFDELVDCGGVWWADV